MAMELFSTEYNGLKEVVKTGTFSEPLKTTMLALKDVFGVKGFDDSCANKLNELRIGVTLKEDEKILQAAGVDLEKSATPNASELKKAAAMKFLRHLYMIQKRGSQAAWVFSSPEKYRQHPSDELEAVKTSLVNLRSKLKDRAEHFSEANKKALGEATTTGLRYCQKTNMVLAAAKKSATSDGMKLVKRWFADGSTTDEQLGTIVSTLADGFKKVTGTINSNQLIFTDVASIRGATAGEAKGFWEAYAFVYAGRYEKIPVVYIEKAFFAENSTPIPEAVLWPITVVHEITHLDVSTKDHQYDFSGLKPGTKLTCAEALDNADSWAYFCADCGGGLSDSNVTKAMTGWS